MPLSRSFLVPSSSPATNANPSSPPGPITGACGMTWMSMFCVPPPPPPPAAAGCCAMAGSTIGSVQSCPHSAAAAAPSALAFSAAATCAASRAIAASASTVCTERESSRAQ
eukprot:3418851-Rhodomonas_salina.1